MATNQNNKIKLGSNRRYDENGFLHVDECILTTEEVAGYLGSEINIEGLDPDKIYGIYRPAEEIDKARETFNGLILTDGHHVISPEKPHKDKWSGVLGTSATFEDGKLKNSLTLITAQAIKDVEDADKGLGGKKDLSCGYSYDLIPEEGQFQGKPYQFKMVNLKGNHLAHVEEGRNPQAMIADDNSNLVSKKEKVLKSLTKILFGAFASDGKSNKASAIKAIKGIAAQDDITEIEKANSIIALVQAMDEDKPGGEKDIMHGMDEEESEAEAKKEKMEKEMKDKKGKDSEASPVPNEGKLEDEDLEEKKKEAEDEEEEEKEKAMDSAIRVREKVISLCNSVVGKMSDRFMLDSSPEKMIDNALVKSGFAIDGKTIEAKVAMLEAVAQLKQAQKPQKSTIALDSVKSSSFIPTKRG